MAGVEVTDTFLLFTIFIWADSEAVVRRPQIMAQSLSGISLPTKITMKVANIRFLLLIFIVFNSCKTIENYDDTCNNFLDNITIVNIGNLDRQGIAQLINKINKRNPAVIGVNVTFQDKRNGDSLLLSSLRNTDNLVISMVSDGEKIIRRSYFDQFDCGLTDLVFNRYNDVAKYLKYRNINGKSYPSFPVKILEKYEESYQYDSSDYNIERITYNGNCRCFVTIDHDEIDNLKDEYIENNIVIIGYLGENYNAVFCVTDKEDAFHVPLPYEPEYDSEAPNMYGSIIMANIIYTLMTDITSTTKNAR